jgi:hypothetical protein
MKDSSVPRLFSTRGATAAENAAAGFFLQSRTHKTHLQRLAAGEFFN